MTRLLVLRTANPDIRLHRPTQPALTAHSTQAAALHQAATLVVLAISKSVAINAVPKHLTLLAVNLSAEFDGQLNLSQRQHFGQYPASDGFVRGEGMRAL